MITNKNYNVDLAKLSDEKIMYGLAKEMYSDEKGLGNESIRDKSLIKVLKSSGILVFAFGVSTSKKKKSFSKTRFLSSDLNEVCDR